MSNLRSHLGWSGSPGPLKYAFHVVFHPFDGFWDLKHEQRGTASAATIILTLVVAASIFMRQYTGYLFNARDPAKMNVYMDISSVVVPSSPVVPGQLGLDDADGRQRDA